MNSPKDVDYVLLNGCKHEIKSHCPTQNEINGILNCLREAKKDANFDPGCKRIVNRRIIQHAKDYRLRPRLQKACQMDLQKFCGQVKSALLKKHLVSKMQPKWV